MRGFVSARYARAVSLTAAGASPAATSGSVSASGSPAGSTRAAIASATTAVQISAESPTCAARAQVASSVSTLAPPTSTWSPTRARAAVESRTSTGERGRMVRARTMHHTNRATTTIASTRWANIATAPGRDRSGTMLSPISGHSRKARPAPSART